MFPTNLAMRLARDGGIHKTLQTELHLDEAMSDFQRVAAVGSFEDAMVIIAAHAQKELTEVHKAILERIYSFTKIEVDGLVIGNVGKIMTNSGLESNRLAAAKVLHEIKNGTTSLDPKDVKKIIFELSSEATQ